MVHTLQMRGSNKLFRIRKYAYLHVHYFSRHTNVRTFSLHRWCSVGFPIADCRVTAPILSFDGRTRVTTTTERADVECEDGRQWAILLNEVMLYRNKWFSIFDIICTCTQYRVQYTACGCDSPLPSPVGWLRLSSSPTVAYVREGLLLRKLAGS